MKIDGVNKETGEVIKPYETPEHKAIMQVITRQVKYVRANIKDGDEEKLSRLNGDVLVNILMVLTGYYEELGYWLANEKLHIADLKTALDLKFAKEYIAWKNEEKQTNETARMNAKIACENDQRDYDENKHAWDVIEAWKKAIGRYHDAVRSQLSYEKSLSQMSRR
jgi:hypothetical protein